MKLIGYIFLFTACVINVALAQVPEDRDGLMKGEGMGQGKFAETKGYPGPKHVLDIADKLQLTDVQKQSVQAIFTEMGTRAKELGARIIDAEEELNTAFVEGLVAETTVRENCEQIGRLRGRLRAVHINAHLKTKKVLTQKQIDLYKKLRSSEGEQKH